jgi:hypothetical protein
VADFCEIRAASDSAARSGAVGEHVMSMHFRLVAEPVGKLRKFLNEKPMPAGLLFLAFQRDPRTGFVKIFENMSKLDLLNQFTTHVGNIKIRCFIVGTMY